MLLLILPDFRSFSYFLSERIFTPFFLFLYHIPILVSLNQLTILDFISFHKSFPIPFQSSTLVLMKSIMEIAPMKRIKIVVKMVSIIVVFLFVSFSNTKIIQFSGLSKFFCNFFNFFLSQIAIVSCQQISESVSSYYILYNYR